MNLCIMCKDVLQVYSLYNNDPKKYFFPIWRVGEGEIKQLLELLYIFVFLDC